MIPLAAQSLTVFYFQENKLLIPASNCGKYPVDKAKSTDTARFVVLQILNCKGTGFVLELFVITHLLSISENKPSPLRRDNSSLFIIFIIIAVLKALLWYRISYQR